jgi:predicted flap endonuclease-1-like 5' DNA nuclease
MEKEKKMKIADIEGIGPKFAVKLAKAGVRSVASLLAKGATEKGRKAIAAASGISDTLILEWVNLADLYRIKGIGSEYSDLLEEAGVDTVAELAKRVPENLFKKMQDVNKAKNLVNKLPGAKQVAGWVAQAKKLPKVVTY